MTNEETLRLLQDHADAWNAHDAEKLLRLMTDDCIYDAAAGASPEGQRHAGRAALKAAFEAIWTTFPDARWDEPRHFVLADRGMTTWIFRGTKVDGSRVEVKGLDILGLRDGRICHKDTYRKTLLG